MENPGAQNGRGPEPESRTDVMKRSTFFLQVEDSCAARHTFMAAPQAVSSCSTSTPSTSLGLGMMSSFRASDSTRAFTAGSLNHLRNTTARSRGCRGTLDVQVQGTSLSQAMARKKTPIGSCHQGPSLTRRPLLRVAAS